VIIVNDAFVRRHFPGEDPIGRRVGIHEAWRRIVGVVGDVRHSTLRDDPNPSAYAPYNQEPHWSSMSLVVFSDVGTDAALASTREVIRQFDAALPVYNVKTMEQILGDSLARMRFSSFLMTVFSVVALLLAAVGIYGVIAYSVSRRTQEIGVRVAVGAEDGDILGLVVKQGMRLAVIGVAVGVAAALALSRLLASILYGIGAMDLSTFAAVAVLLILVALLACYLPARRATKVDPMVALRYE
jgi:putative ABC transport system permease protein